jgi:hypothetical protein
MRMVTEAASANSPDKLVATITALKGLVQVEQGKGNSDSQIVSLLMQGQAALQTQLAAAQERHDKLMEKLIDAKSVVPKAPDPDAGLFANLDKLEKLRGFFSGGDEGSGMGSGGGKWWQSLLTSPIMPEISQTLRLTAEAFYNWASRGLGGPEAASVGAPGSQVLTNPTAHLRGDPGTLGVETPRVASQQPPSQQLSPQVAMLVEMAKLMRGAIDLGLPGDEFAEKLEHRYGAATYEQIVAVPLDQALLALKGIPQVWAILGPVEAHLPEFLTAFYEYAKPGPEEPPDQEPEVISAEPRKRNRKGVS